MGKFSDAIKRRFKKPDIDPNIDAILAIECPEKREALLTRYCNTKKTRP